MKKKKIIAILLAIVLAFSCLASSFSAFAITQTISYLDTKYTAETDGSDDLVWFKYTPEQSGMYTFFSVETTRKSEAYLFIREKQADGSKLYTQLAYSNSSPNYLEYGQKNSSQFCLTYHLEAGVTYYYAAGWQLSSTTSANMQVKLICEGYDDNLLTKIEASCPASLVWYTDGQWSTDATGKQYYQYNISKIISNTTVTLYYADGTTKSVTGVSEVDGLMISFSHDQNERHWYASSDELYTSNDLTVTVLNQSATMNINIEESELHPVKGRVIDYATGNPIKDAKILINSQSATVTDENGNFAFTSAAGTYEMRIVTDTSVDRIIYLTINAQAGSNDHTLTPYKLITGDHYDDEVINVKDLVAVKKSTMLTNNEKNAETAKINKSLSASADNYQ